MFVLSLKISLCLHQQEYNQKQSNGLASNTSPPRRGDLTIDCAIRLGVGSYANAKDKLNEIVSDPAA